MSARNIHFHDKIRKFPKNIPKYLFSREVPDLKTSLNQPW